MNEQSILPRFKSADAIAYARQRGRVVNTETGQTGNLVDWMPGHSCKVFVRWDHSCNVKMPIFETWSKGVTIRETDLATDSTVKG